MPDDGLPIPKTGRREFPEPEERRKLTDAEKKIVRDRQGGKCNGCGIVPKRWEYDHIRANWTGQCDQSNLDEWQGLGSRDDCSCHAEKTAEEAALRAKRDRLRGVTGQRARREKHGSMFRKPAGYVSPLSSKNPRYRP